MGAEGVIKPGHGGIQVDGSVRLTDGASSSFMMFVVYTVGCDVATTRDTDASCPPERSGRVCIDSPHDEADELKGRIVSNFGGETVPRLNVAEVRPQNGNTGTRSLTNGSRTSSSTGEGVGALVAGETVGAWVGDAVGEDDRLGGAAGTAHAP